MTMAEVERDIVQDLLELNDEMRQYTYLIGCADCCRMMSTAQHRPEYLIKDCQVNTWMYVEWKNGKCIPFFDSESLIVKGVLALIQEIYRGKSQAEIESYHCGLVENPIIQKALNRAQYQGLMKILSMM